jgi:ubiquinol-cytochrome c reductase cytochrome c1 subunit
LRSGLATGIATGALLGTTIIASDALTPPEYDWPHRGPMSAYDTATLRRGFEVYRQVCATCHSLHFIHYRNLVGVTHTEDQAKALAASVEVHDGPDENGEMFDRPGKLMDAIPAPYPNDEAARAANNGALPPDLSLITKARPFGEDYIFALLTSYSDPPAGFALRSGMYYNRYFSGGTIGMPPPLVDEQVEYEDGTPATISQMAKDVICFLAWAAEPEADERKKQGLKGALGFALVALVAAYQKRFYFNLHKSRKISYPKDILS